MRVTMEGKSVLFQFYRKAFSLSGNSRSPRLENRFLASPYLVEAREHRLLFEVLQRVIFVGRKIIPGDVQFVSCTQHPFDVHTDRPVLRQTNQRK